MSGNPELQTFDHFEEFYQPNMMPNTSQQHTQIILQHQQQHVIGQSEAYDPNRPHSDGHVAQSYYNTNGDNFHFVGEQHGQGHVGHNFLEENQMILSSVDDPNTGYKHNLNNNNILDYHSHSPMQQPGYDIISTG